MSNTNNQEYEAAVFKNQTLSTLYTPTNTHLVEKEKLFSSGTAKSAASDSPMSAAIRSPTMCAP